MTPGDLVTTFRSDVGDLAEPFLWSTPEVWNYMNQAQWKFAKIVGVAIRDSSTAAYCQAAMTASDPWVPIHANITKIRSARLSSTGKGVGVMSYEELFMKPDGPSDDYGLPMSLTELELEGEVKRVIIGMEKDKLRAVRIPEANDTLLLVVERLPVKVTVDGDEAFEIREDYHLDLLWWMKHLAYAKQDADTFDKERSESAEQMFYKRAAEAMVEHERKNHKPRLMAYGGI